MSKPNLKAALEADPRRVSAFAQNAELVLRARKARQHAERACQSVTETMRLYAQSNNVALGTLYRKMREYDARGLVALLDTRGRHAHHHKGVAHGH